MKHDGRKWIIGVFSVCRRSSLWNWNASDIETQLYSIDYFPAGISSQYSKNNIIKPFLYKRSRKCWTKPSFKQKTSIRQRRWTNVLQIRFVLTPTSSMRWFLCPAHWSFFSTAFQLILGLSTGSTMQSHIKVLRSAGQQWFTKRARI